LNKNNEYRDQIKYKILTMTRDTLMDWQVDIFKNFKKKSRSNTWLWLFIIINYL